MNINSKTMFRAAYVYMTLPFVIFMFGWMKLYISIPLFVVLAIAFIKMSKDAPELKSIKISKDNIMIILFILLIIGLWVYFSGIGKFVYQNSDHTVRNTTFNILVNSDWPVISLKGVGDATSGVALIYYIGFWLPAAVVGKIFGLRIGYYFLALWAFIGLALVFYFISARRGKIRIWPLALFMAFSGLDILGIYLTGMDLPILSNTLHLEWWDVPYQFTSTTAQLFWVFNQSIPAWLCTIVVLMQKNNRSIIMILASLLLMGSLPFVGLAILAAFLMFTRKYDITITSVKQKSKAKAHLQAFIKDTFTFQNIVGGGIIGIITAVYLAGNISGSNFMTGNSNGAVWDMNLTKWIVFAVLEFGIYFVMIYKYQKKNVLYYFSFVCLVLLSLFKLGFSNDWCMRTTIPALMLLTLMIIDTLEISFEKKDYRIIIPLIIALSIGAITPLNEATRTLTETYSRINAGVPVYAEDESEEAVMSSRNCIGPVDGNFFFEYLAKQHTL